MTEIKNKNKIIGLLSVMLLLVSLIGIFPIKVNAAAADITVTIDTGNEITLKDSDGNSYYDIGTADELYAFAAEVNGGNGNINGELTADIVVNENVLDENGELNDNSNFRVWTPIGVVTNYWDGTNYEAETVFHGKFNGGNHTVNGLYFIDEEQLHVGLFGATYGASIRNVGVLDSYINGYMYVGGVVGVLGKGALENCYNAGSVIGGSDVGGVAGWAGKSSTVQNCFNTGNVSGRYGTIGGVVGYIWDVDNTTTLKNCYSTGRVVLLGSHSVGSSGRNTTRGVIGSVENKNTVENCFFLENIVTINGTMGNGSSVSAGTQAVSFTQFVSGEVAYKLGSAFGQTLAGENRQNYPVLGGTPVTASERFYIHGQQLNLGSDLSMKYYVTAYTEGFDPAHLQMQFIHNGVVTTPEYKIIDGFYVFTLDGINPQCMGDNIYAKLFYMEEEVASHGYEEKYSVEENLKKLLIEYKDDTALVTLINDLLAYGKASEGYTRYESMTGEYPVKEVSTVSFEFAEYTNKSENVELVGVNVRFGTMNYLVFKFKGEGLSTDSIFAIDAEAPADKYIDSEGNLIVVSKPISPDNFYDNVRLNYYEGDEILIEIDYSINAYCETIITGSGYRDEMTALAKALYNYGVSAELYKHAKTGVGEHTYDSAVNNGETHTKFCACGESIIEGHSFDGNGECVCGEKAAIISTLDDLKAAIQNGGEYMLGDNIHVPESLKVETEIILQLNGKNITGDGEIFWVNTGGALTILGDGVLSMNTDGIIIYVGGVNNPSVNIAGGTIEGEIDVAMGTCEISGGQIELINAMSGDCICEISGGQIEMLNRGEGACTVSGGYIKIWTSGVGAFTITGGTFGYDPTAYVDTENYTVTNNGDGTWTVTAK